MAPRHIKQYINTKSQTRATRITLKNADIPLKTTNCSCCTRFADFSVHYVEGLGFNALSKKYRNSLRSCVITVALNEKRAFGKLAISLLPLALNKCNAHAASEKIRLRNYNHRHIIRILR